MTLYVVELQSMTTEALYYKKCGTLFVFLKFKLFINTNIFLPCI